MANVSYRAFLGMLGLSLLSLTFPVACGPSTFIMEAYSGPTRPANSIAVIRVDGASNVMVIAMDGQMLAPVASDTRLHIEVLPGRHVLLAQSQLTPEDPAQHVAFKAEPGKFYRVSFVTASERRPGALEARVYELDPKSGASGTDVTLTPGRAAR